MTGRPQVGLVKGRRGMIWVHDMGYPCHIFYPQIMVYEPGRQVKVISKNIPAQDVAYRIMEPEINDERGTKQHYEK